MPLAKEKKYQEALEQFTLAANNLGFAYYKLEQYEAAVQWFRRTIDLDPRRAVAYLNLGDAYLKLARPAEAKEAFLKTVELQPGSKSAAYAQERLKSLN